MDKKIIGLGILSVIVVIYAIAFIVHSQQGYNKVCKDLGFEKTIFKGNMDYCKDTEGNLYYAEVNCPAFSWKPCTGRLISVGDVRIKENLGG